MENRFMELKTNLAKLSSEELTQILHARNEDEWTTEAFAAIEEILIERKILKKGELVCLKCGEESFDYSDYYKEFTCKKCGSIISENNSYFHKKSDHPLVKPLKKIENELSIETNEATVAEKKVAENPELKAANKSSTERHAAKREYIKSQKKIARVIGIITGFIFFVGSRSPFIDYPTTFMESGLSGAAGTVVGYLLSLFGLFIIYGNEEIASKQEKSARNSYIILIAILPLLILIPLLGLVIDPLIAFSIIILIAIFICISSFLFGLKYYRLGINRAFTAIILSPFIFLLLIISIIAKLK
jgi:hypothetical protein